MTVLQDSDGGLSRLRVLVAEISTTVERLNARPQPARDPADSWLAKSLDHGAPDPILTGYIAAMLRLRRRRERLFGEDLFADPAWDMLLDLALAQRQGRQVSVSSLCIASAVPATTALRWIRIMTDQGLLIRQRDPDDGRRQYLGLTDKAAHLLDEFLGEMGREILRSLTQ